MVFKLNLVCNPIGITGYNVHSRNLLFALDKVCDVALESAPIPEKFIHTYEKFRNKKYSEENTLMITYPDHFRFKFVDDIPILAGYGVFEGDRVPLNWARNCKDERLDILFTPSQHTKTAFINSGVPKDKIKVVSHGVNCDVFKPEGKKLWDDEVFRFLFVGGWKDGVFDRKGLDIAFRAYKEEFAGLDNDKIRFIGKINMAYGGDIRANMESLNLPEGPPDIDIITNDLNETQLSELYRSCDVLVMPTKGESFCFPVAEALACGCPVVATDYGGHTEYSKRFGLLVEANWIDATGGIYYEGVRWKQIDYTKLKESLRLVYENSEKYKKLGLKGAKYVKRCLTWNHIVKRIIKEFRNYK